jgi:hypothetical protein
LQIAHGEPGPAAVDHQQRSLLKASLGLFGSVGHLGYED